MAWGETPKKAESKNQDKKTKETNKEGKLSQEEIKNISKFDAIWKKIYLKDQKNPQPISYNDEFWNSIKVVADDEPRKSIMIFKETKWSKAQETALIISFDKNNNIFSVDMRKNDKSKNFNSVIFVEPKDIMPYLEMVTNRIQRIKENSIKQAQKYSSNQDRELLNSFEDFFNQETAKEQTA